MPLAVHLEPNPRSTTVLTPNIDAIEPAGADATKLRWAKIEPNVSLAIDDHLDPAAMTAALRCSASVRSSAEPGSVPLFEAPAVSNDVLA